MPDSPDEIPIEREPDMADDALGLGLTPEKGPTATVAISTNEAASPYRVLARKYRPQTFAELIGQDAMVQTLANAIKRGRLAHAFLMTGVRGVGKTSTARLIAKALNCIGPDGTGGPTIAPCGICEPCVAITEGRHIDVIEMDAASHTGVDDVREIIEAVRYSSVSARFKIYIIDEVHMLSKNAFNALLKTLEEPPAHVKFLFATTEVTKVPITVLSRCQRFDLKRITPELLKQNFRMICEKEGVEAENEALDIIAVAAEGSARDGQSILDQAIAHADMDGGGKVNAVQVREMLGLSDKAAVRRLFRDMLTADVQAVLAGSNEQFQLGTEPLSLMSALLEEVHRITLAKVGAPVSEELDSHARNEIDELGEALTFPVLHRLWQLLLKGHEEVARATMPQQAADMALLRVMHAANMPDPGELARLVQEGGAHIGKAAPAEGGDRKADSDGPSAEMPIDFTAFVEMVASAGHFTAENVLRDSFRIVSYAPPQIIYQTSSPLPSNFVTDLNTILYQLTGKRWEILEGEGDATPSLTEILVKAETGRRQTMMNSPLVKAALAAFPDAEIDFDEHSGSAEWSKSA
jgi:DNA polymerase III subunit gamma/tau